MRRTYQNIDAGERVAPTDGKFIPYVGPYIGNGAFSRSLGLLNSVPLPKLGPTSLGHRSLLHVAENFKEI